MKQVLLLLASVFVGCQRSHQVPYTLNKIYDTPQVIYDDHSEFVTIYNKAWQLAKAHVDSCEGLVQTPYIDEAFAPQVIWIWDTVFMLHFFKYASSDYPALASLNNFYGPIHDNIDIPLKIEIPDNPPLFAWIEYAFFKQNGDTAHIKELLYDKQYLQKHFEWFDSVSRGTIIAHSAPTCIEKDIHGYRWEGGRSGMDNTPRGRKGNHAKVDRPNNPDMLWIDAIAQQGLSALYISRLFDAIEDQKHSKIWMDKYEKIRTMVNRYYWDDKDGTYYDIDRNNLTHMKLLTPASYWPILAEIASPEQVQRMVKHLEDEQRLGGKVPWTTVARNDRDFDPNGGYWRGSIWLPTAYMGIKAIEKYGYRDLAHHQAKQIVSHMYNTYKEYTPHTIWECYNPNSPKPATDTHGHDVRPDFCGWSALGPISLMIENILGFYEIDGRNKTVKWDLRGNGKQGIYSLRFGKVITDIIYNEGQVNVESNNPYTLVIKNQLLNIPAGKSTWSITSY
ncbi:trehalase family glycosidase [Prolixibacteraceae bacterium]|nr:trehalase family glycosidase [Prolixibacteraceae bacterium]